MAFTVSSNFTVMIRETFSFDGSSDPVTNDTPPGFDVIYGPMPGQRQQPDGPPVNRSTGDRWTAPTGITYVHHSGSGTWTSTHKVTTCMWCGQKVEVDLIDLHEEGCS